MLGTYSYNEIIRKTIIAFGTLFNEVYIKHEEQDGTDYSFIKVPIAYGPIQKFLARVEQKPDLKKRVAMTLPRMSFEMTSLKYDSSRKVSSMQTFKAIKTTDRTEQVKVFMPVPYNIGFQLSIMTKLNDDMLQIVEQILPAFQPSFTLTINLISSIFLYYPIYFCQYTFGVRVLMKYHEILLSGFLVIHLTMYFHLKYQTMMFR
jgi:hypothetical protein